MVFVLPELFAAKAALARRGVLVHVPLEAAVGAEAAAADRTAEWVVFTGHRASPLRWRLFWRYAEGSAG